MDILDKEWGGFVSGAVVGAFVGVALAIFAVTDDFKAEAIERGCAQYDTVSGKWRWIEEKKSE